MESSVVTSDSGDGVARSVFGTGGEPSDGSDLEQELEHQLDRDPRSRSIWEPLSRLYRERRRYEKLEALEQRLLAVLSDAHERNLLRMERVRLLLDGEASAISLLRRVLVEEPFNREALERLTVLLERAGDRAAVTYLLGRQIDAARERSDVETIASVSLRLDAMAESPAEATAILRRALVNAPEHRGLLEALWRRTEFHGPLPRRIELLVRLIELDCTDRDPRAAAIHARALADTGRAGGELLISDIRSSSPLGAAVQRAIQRLEAFVADQNTQAEPENRPRLAALYWSLSQLHSVLGESSAMLAWLRAGQEAARNDQQEMLGGSHVDDGTTP